MILNIRINFFNIYLHIDTVYRIFYIKLFFSTIWTILFYFSLFSSIFSLCTIFFWNFFQSSKTLRILHLPPTLTDERRDELLKKFNAIKTKTIRKSPKFTITFAEFFSKEIATEAFLRLHQLEVKGHRLSIEFAKKSIDSDYTKTDCGKKADEQEVKKETTEKVHLENFLKKLNSWTGSNAFTQPPNPNITYKYPAPTRETLLRIAIQLIKEPMFYTQVSFLFG